jgi:hypothetical protein
MLKMSKLPVRKELKEILDPSRDHEGLWSSNPLFVTRV